MPKMQEFHGESDRWASFKFQFKQAAHSFKWDERTKLDRLLSCLRNKAVEYIQKRPKGTLKDYRKLMKDLQQRYGQKDPPSTSRRQLSYAKQEEAEDLEEYAERVHQLVIDGFPGVDNDNIQLLAVDAFLRGCNNKFAAVLASGHKLKTLRKAVRKVKAGIHDQKSIGKLQYSVRQVNFEEGVAAVTQSVSPIFKKFEGTQAAELSEIVAAAVKSALSALLKPRSSEFTVGSRYPPSPRGCFICKSEGHYARECPKRASSPSSPARGTSPTRNLNCYICDQKGHFANACPKKPAPASTLSES